MGQTRDDARKIHPDLRPWEQLADEIRERDRIAVSGLERDFADVLADFGLQIIRTDRGDDDDDGGPGVLVPET